MLTANNHKKFTSCGDVEAEALLKKVLLEIRKALSGTELCVFLGGSYGRGDGGVRLDRENGILYNDLDFFVFARNTTSGDAALLKKIAEKYEHELKVDVDFSRIMTVDDIKNNASRLMMQELKRGYYPVCGEDLLAEYLPEIPADRIPFSEACRLLLIRGMGLLLAGAKISGNDSDTDFILRNLYKAILGAGDAMMISAGEYRWKIADRLDYIEKSELPAQWKDLYREAVEFKHSPHRQKKADMIAFWNSVRDFVQASAKYCSDDDFRAGIYNRCCKSGEISLKNYIKYCIRSRTFPLIGWKYYTIPAVAVLVKDIYSALEKMPEKIDEKSKLYRHWLIFN